MVYSTATSNFEDTEAVDLEIDEVTEENLLTEKSQIFLTSAVITKELESPERYLCPLWVQGLERSLKVRGSNLIKVVCFYDDCSNFEAILIYKRVNFVPFKTRNGY